MIRYAGRDNQQILHFLSSLLPYIWKTPLLYEMHPGGIHFEPSSFVLYQTLFGVLCSCAAAQRRLGLSTKNPSRFLYHVYKHYIGISNTASFYCLHISNKSFIVHEVYAPVISTASFDTACDWTWTNVSALKRVKKL